MEARRKLRVMMVVASGPAGTALGLDFRPVKHGKPWLGDTWLGPWVGNGGTHSGRGCRREASLTRGPGDIWSSGQGSRPRESPGDFDDI